MAYSNVCVAELNAVCECSECDGVPQTAEEYLTRASVAWSVNLKAPWEEEPTKGDKRHK